MKKSKTGPKKQHPIYQNSNLLAEVGEGEADKGEGLVVHYMPVEDVQLVGCHGILKRYARLEHFDTQCFWADP